MLPSIESQKRSSSVLDEGATTSSQVRRRLSSDIPAQSDTFHAVLAKAKCFLGSRGPPTLACDHRNVVQQLDRQFRSDPGLAAKFLDCFQSFVADEANFRRILQPMLLPSTSAIVRSSESLARVLLSVGQTQSDVATYLLEKLPEFVGELEVDGRVPLPPLMDSIPRLILSQFRWLEFLVDSRTLTEKILEVLSICPLALKKDIITFLPEVIVDADHEMVVQTFETMLQDDLQLIVPILDAFSNLNLEEGLYQQVVALALSSLGSADAEDLPLLVKFLLQSVTAANVTQVVQQLRENLHFVAMADVRATKADRKLKGKSTATNCEALVLEAIRSGVRFQNLILEAALKEVRNVEGLKNHRVFDIWLLLIIHANGGPHRKTAEQLLLKKITLGDVSDSLLRQSIQGRGDSLQDYFQTLVSVSEACLRSKEVPARQFGKTAYGLLFQEFVGPFYRQEVLGALISHTGSGNSLEIGSALQTLLLFATKHASDLLPISSFINGVLDHLEGFQDNHLHQVYQIFSQLAVTAWSKGGLSSGSSIGSELLIVVRKQITNSEPQYRRMGIIGAVELASCFGTGGANGQDGDALGSSTEEIVSLLQMTLEACKSSPLFRGFFYDQLTSQLEAASLGTSFLNWIAKHTSEFEGAFLGDLDGGQLQTAHDFGLLEGELWMNLDDDMSPIVLDILPMLMKDDQSSREALNYLPANFRLLASMERVVNQDSLGSIDALLGCPMLLPKQGFLVEEKWKTLTNHQKELVCHSLYYAINWIRELINAFSTQLDSTVEINSTQTTREETIAKLFKRIRNLMFLEHSLRRCLESTRVSFDPLYFTVQPQIQARPHPRSQAAPGTKKVRAKKREKKDSSTKRSTHATNTQNAAEADSQGVLASDQQTIKDAFNKSKATGGIDGTTTAEASQRGNDSPPSCTAAQPPEAKELRTEGLGDQRWKFRPLTLSSLSMLGESQASLKSCCLDPSAQLPVLLYLFEDLLLKLDQCLEAPARKLSPWLNSTVAAPKEPSGLGGLSGIAVLEKMTPLYSSIRKHLDCAIAILQADNSDSQRLAENETCGDHWAHESEAAGNPYDDTFTSSTPEAAQTMILVMIRCFGKVFLYPGLTLPVNGPLLSTLLSAFGNGEGEVSDLGPRPMPGSLEEAFCNAYNYLDGLSAAAAAVSFTSATELVMVLKALINCLQASNSKDKEDTRRRRFSSDKAPGVLPYLRSRLSLSAGKVLGQDWSAEDWKNKADILQQLIRMQIENSDSPVELLEELVSTVMPQVASKGSKVAHGTLEGYPALTSGTFPVWYRVAHQEILDLLADIIKNFLAQSKSKRSVADDSIVSLLNRAHQIVTLHVTLVNFTKHHDKAATHATAVKFGGKFVDTFLKGMDFLKSHYDTHKESINELVKELQKATRIIQTLCSEAKGQKRMPITCKVPIVKRSMERYVYCVKALLHSTAHGSSFWMGNLKHKDLQGHEISSQPYAAADEEDEDDNQSDDQERDNEDEDGEGEGGEEVNNDADDADDAEEMQEI